MSEKNYYQENYRPQIHFSPEKNWMNDPNGLVYADGLYHLFYQHNPAGDLWGNISWGHAISDDLLHWQHQPVAIKPNDKKDTLIFSGGCVHDFCNSSCLGSGDQTPLVAFYTHSGDRGQNQRQSISYSLDSGETWTEYEKNPVITNPGMKDFRDPKVFWYEPESLWIMLVAAGQSIFIYHSFNLLDWHFVSSFGERIGAHGGDWECPDLFALPVDGDSSKLFWVLLVSINPGAPNGGSATQYFIGEFDGKIFTPLDRHTRWMDFGPDSYAGITWEAAPGQLTDRILIAWMSNWNYAFNLPTSPWRGQMTLPRKLTLVDRSDGLVLSSKPISQLESLRGESINFTPGQFGCLSKSLTLPPSASFEIQLSVDIGPNVDVVGLSLSNSIGQKVELYLDLLDNRLVIDRSKTLIDESLKNYPYSYSADCPMDGVNILDLHVVCDSCSIEVFALNGTVVMTGLYFIEKPFDQVNLFNMEGESTIVDGKLWPLNSTWVISQTLEER